MGQTDRHARGFTLRHVINRVTVTAEPAYQHAMRDVVALMKLVTLAAGVKDRANLAVVAAREQKAQPLAGPIAIAEQARLTAFEPSHRDRQQLGAPQLDAARPQYGQRGDDRDCCDERPGGKFFWPDLSHRLRFKG